jgi:hypothetical protein
VKTDCSAKQVEFEGVGTRRLVATFDAEHITSDGGLALLHEVDRRFGLLRKFAECFTDHRAPELLHHTVVELVRQRVFGIACGYEELSDHSALRVDPLLAAVVGKAEPTQPLASSSTLNRLGRHPPAQAAEGRRPRARERPPCRPLAECRRPGARSLRSHRPAPAHPAHSLLTSAAL